MSAGIPVIKFLFNDSFKVLNEALNLSPGYTVEEISTANDLSTFLSTEPAALVIASLKNKNDLIQIATFVKLAKKVAKDTAIKIVVINFSGDRTFDKAIAKLGIQDLIETGINTKALKFKLDFWMKSLNAQIKNNPNSSAQKTVKSLDQNKAQDKKADPTIPVWVEPLDLEDDIWILKSEADAKKVLAKWLIRLLGPSPYIGQWTEVKGGIWRFDIKESEKELYCPNPGAWFFHGDQKPDFVWKENIWMITGDTFELYYKEKEQVYSRLKSKDKVLTMAKNSLFAKTKEPVIIESFDKELVFKKEAQKLEDLEGKNKTDQINGDPLSGKNKPADKLGGNLSGKVESEEAINHENLSQKTTTARESKFWGGKNSADASKDDDFTGPKADGPNAGADLSRDRKDNEHKKFYKNHNEAEKYEAPEEKERKANGPEKQAGNLAGKSSTDEVPKHYDNSNAQREKNTPEAKKQEDEYSGKSNTDKLKSHLGAKEKTEAEKKEAGDLDGKSSTDKIDAHYGGVKAKQLTPEEKERERKDKEEKIFKERLQTAERNKAEQTERERRLKDDREEAKAQNEKLREEKEAASIKKAQAEEKEAAATRKNQVDEKEASKSKTAVEKNWEGDHDYEMNGQSETEKLSAHYKSKQKNTAEAKASDKDEAAESPFGKRKASDRETGETQGSVLPFGKKEDKKPLTQEEKELEEITRDAKVISVLMQNGKKANCNLDDYFDETIIFSTDAQHIDTSSKVFLDLLFKFEKDTKLKMEGNVLTVEGDGEGNNYVTVQVSKESAVALGSFMKLYEVRQQNVNEFLKKVKGL